MHFKAAVHTKNRNIKLKWFGPQDEVYLPTSLSMILKHWNKSIFVFVKVPLSWSWSIQNLVCVCPFMVLKYSKFSQSCLLPWSWNLQLQYACLWPWCWNIANSSYCVFLSMVLKYFVSVCVTLYMLLKHLKFSSLVIVIMISLGLSKLTC